MKNGPRSLETSQCSSLAYHLTVTAIPFASLRTDGALPLHCAMPEEPPRLTSPSQTP